MSKHTPGPWEHVPGGFTIKAPSDRLSFQLIAALSTGMKTRDEVDANARLIAAAPELLAALRLARANLSDKLEVMVMSHHNPVTGTVDNAEVALIIEAEQDLLNQIDAAIAKATGEPQ